MEITKNIIKNVNITIAIVLGLIFLILFILSKYSKKFILDTNEINSIFVNIMFYFIGLTIFFFTLGLDIERKLIFDNIDYFLNIVKSSSIIQYIPVKK